MFIVKVGPRLVQAVYVLTHIYSALRLCVTIIAEILFTNIVPYIILNKHLSYLQDNKNCSTHNINNLQFVNIEAAIFITSSYWKIE